MKRANQQLRMIKKLKIMKYLNGKVIKIHLVNKFLKSDNKVK